MPDRYPPDDATGDLGDQESRRDQGRWQARANPQVSKPLKVRTRLRSLLKSPTEVEPLGDHRAMRGTEGFLVRDPVQVQRDQVSQAYPAASSLWAAL
jgi:hypothetical protein